VLEQNFEFDLVGSQKLMEKYIDRQISVVLVQGDKTETVTGTLLSAAGGGLVLQTPDGVRIVSGQQQQIKLGALPCCLITKPTLLRKVTAGKGAPHRVLTCYQTSGITWRSDYNVVLNAADTQADIGAWVTLMNLTGAGYKNAQLKLIAGDVQRIQPRRMLMEE